METTSASALWGAVAGLGLYHGLNPGMGWPLAVSAALMERRAGALPKAMLALGAGHFLSMLAVLLPFALLTMLVQWADEISIAAALLLITLGLYLLIKRDHPRFLARVSPARLGLWSFLVAIAHGAGLMLVPIYLGICAVGAADGAAFQLIGGNSAMAVLVALVHSLAMGLAGLAIAAALYYWLGLKALARTWINFDAVWAGSLILVGAVSLWRLV